MDFHALEGLQCMVERRGRGETGVKAVQLIEGDAVWKAGEEGRWSKDLLISALSRSDTPLGTGETESRPEDLVSSGQLPKLVANPAAYFIEYRDGLKATLLMLDGALKDFNFAARLKRHAGNPGNAVPPDPRPQRDLFGVPGARDRTDVPNPRGAVPDRTHASGQRHPGKLPDLESAESPAPGNTPSQGCLPAAGAIHILPELDSRGWRIHTKRCLLAPRVFFS